jgi:hypothetical protein
MRQPAELGSSAPLPAIVGSDKHFPAIGRDERTNELTLMG